MSKSDNYFYFIKCKFRLENKSFWKLGHFEMWLTSKITHFRNLVTSKDGSLRIGLILKIGSLRNVAHFENYSFQKLGHFEIWLISKRTHFENCVTSKMTHFWNRVTSKYGSLWKGIILKIASLRKNCFWKLGYFEIRLTTKVTHLRNWATSKYDSLRKKLISKIGSLRNLAHFENESFRESGHFGNWVYHFKQVQKLFYKNLKMPGRHPFLFLVEKYCSILMNFGSLCQDSEFGQMRTFEFAQRWQQWLFIEKIKVTNI